MSYTETIKRNIRHTIEKTVTENERLQQMLTDVVSMTAYTPNGDDWTAVFQQALNEQHSHHSPLTFLPISPILLGMDLHPNMGA